MALYWENLANIAQDYTVFVHVVDDAGNVLGQGDGPPLSGAYPTSYWGAGDLLQDEHLITLEKDLDLPEDGLTARVFVGFYDLESGRRLPFINDDGLQLGDSTVAATIRLVP